MVEHNTILKYVFFSLKLDRDTQKCAYKCSHAVINGEGVDVFKQPVTDPGKTSKKGRLALIHTSDGSYSTVKAEEADPKEVRLFFSVIHTVLSFGKKKEWLWDGSKCRFKMTFKSIVVYKFQYFHLDLH